MSPSGEKAPHKMNGGEQSAGFSSVISSARELCRSTEKRTRKNKVNVVVQSERCADRRSFFCASTNQTLGNQYESMHQQHLNTTSNNEEYVDDSHNAILQSHHTSLRSKKKKPVQMLNAKNKLFPDDFFGGKRESETRFAAVLEESPCKRQSKANLEKRKVALSQQHQLPSEAPSPFLIMSTQHQEQSPASRPNNKVVSSSYHKKGAQSVKFEGRNAMKLASLAKQMVGSRESQASEGELLPNSGYKRASPRHSHCGVPPLHTLQILQEVRAGHGSGTPVQLKVSTNGKLMQAMVDRLLTNPNSAGSTDQQTKLHSQKSSGNANEEAFKKTSSFLREPKVAAGSSNATRKNFKANKAIKLQHDAKVIVSRTPFSPDKKSSLQTKNMSFSQWQQELCLVEDSEYLGKQSRQDAIGDDEEFNSAKSPSKPSSCRFKNFQTPARHLKSQSTESEQVIQEQVDESSGEKESKTSYLEKIDEMKRQGHQRLNLGSGTKSRKQAISGTVTKKSQSSHGLAAPHHRHHQQTASVKKMINRSFDGSPSDQKNNKTTPQVVKMVINKGAPKPLPMPMSVANPMAKDFSNAFKATQEQQYKLVAAPAPVVPFVVAKNKYSSYGQRPTIRLPQIFQKVPIGANVVGKIEKAIMRDCTDFEAKDGRKKQLSKVTSALSMTEPNSQVTSPKNSEGASATPNFGQSKKQRSTRLMNLTDMHPDSTFGIENTTSTIEETLTSVAQSQGELPSCSQLNGFEKCMVYQQPHGGWRARQAKTYKVDAVSKIKQAKETKDKSSEEVNIFKQKNADLDRDVDTPHFKAERHRSFHRKESTSTDYKEPQHQLPYEPFEQYGLEMLDTEKTTFAAMQGGLKDDKSMDFNIGESIETDITSSKNHLAPHQHYFAGARSRDSYSPGLFESGSVAHISTSGRLAFPASSSFYRNSESHHCTHSQAEMATQRGR